MKKRSIVNFFVMTLIVIFCVVKTNAVKLNIMGAIRTSVEYSIGNGYWYNEAELKAKMWNITNVYMRITCDLQVEDDKKLEYESVDCFMNVKGDIIQCIGNVNKYKNTIVITTLDPITTNFTSGYLYIGNENAADRVLVGGGYLKLDLIKNWSGVEQTVTVDVKYGARESGPWFNSEAEVVNNLLEDQTLYEIYVNVNATTNVGNMKSVSMTKNGQIVAEGVNNFIYRINSKKAQFDIVAESESRIRVQKSLSISSIGEVGSKKREYININVQYGVRENGPWHSRESEILNDVLLGETINKIYIKADATTNIGNISGIKITRQGSVLKSGIDSVIYEVTSNTIFEIIAESETATSENYKLEIFSIGEKGKKEKQEITIGVKYSKNETGPWYDEEKEVLNDIGENQTLSKIYIKANATIDRGSIQSIAIGQNENELKSGTDSVVCYVTSNAKFYIKAESHEATEKTTYVDITNIRKKGIPNADKITISLKYGISDNGPWYDNQSDVLSDVLENEKLEKVYVMAQATAGSGSINEMIIKADAKELRTTKAGLIIQEINENTTFTVIAKSSKGAVKSWASGISDIGKIGIREEIDVSIEYAQSSEGTWYEKESQLLVNEQAASQEWVKIQASSNKKDISKIEIKNGDSIIVSSESGYLEHSFDENMDGLLVVITSGSGKVITRNMAISGVRRNESYITIGVTYGISESGPWRLTQEDVLNDVKASSTVSEIYVRAIAQINIGSISSMQIKKDGVELKTETSNAIVYKFTQNTTGNSISIIATDNYDNTKTWVGDITKIGTNGVKNSNEDGSDSTTQTITDNFEENDWDIRKDIDWRNAMVSEKELKIKDQYTNVPEIKVSRVGGSSDIAIVTIKTMHDGESNYSVRYRLASKVEDKSFSEISFGSWQNYSGPFKVSNSTYVEAEGRYNSNNLSGRSAIKLINIEETDGASNSAMYIMDDKNLPLTSSDQYFVAYYKDPSSNKYYKQGSSSTQNSLSGNGNMFAIKVNKETNTTITLGENKSISTITNGSSTSSQESAAYRVDNAIKISSTGSNGVYKVTLTPGDKITDVTIKEVGIIGEYVLNGVTNGIVRKTNSIYGNNGVFSFEIKNVPSLTTYKAYYINEDNEMIMETK